MSNVSNVKYGKLVTLVIFLNVISKTKNKQKQKSSLKTKTNQTSFKCDLKYDVIAIFPHTRTHTKHETQPRSEFVT